MLLYSNYSHLLLPWEIFSTDALFFLQNRFQKSKKIPNSNAVHAYILFHYNNLHYLHSCTYLLQLLDFIILYWNP